MTDKTSIETSRDQEMFPTLTAAQILMRAFILRRVMLIAGQFGDVVLVGSIHCAGTLRVKQFLTRNGHPYSYIDLDRDDGVQELLDHFHLSAADVPILICRGKVVLRDPTNEAIAACLGFNDAIDETHVRGAVIVGGHRVWRPPFTPRRRD